MYALWHDLGLSSGSCKSSLKRALGQYCGEVTTLFHCPTHITNRPGGSTRRGSSLADSGFREGFPDQGGSRFGN
jgi:hypothetical protein